MNLASARVWLFVPGDRPERFDRALASGADVVIVDLEDAVAPERRELARVAVVAALAGGAQFAVRISSPATHDGAADLEALATAPNLPLAVVVAKAERVADLERVGELGIPVVPLVESAAGLLAASVLAGYAATVRLAFGAVDFSLDAGCSTDPDVLGPVRLHLAVASAAAGIAPPLDSPELDFTDLEPVTAAALEARRRGMGGKLCIHPAQVPVVRATFMPTAKDVAWAERVLSVALDDGAAAVDGKLIDRPVLERARRIVHEASERSRLCARE